MAENVVHTEPGARVVRYEVYGRVQFRAHYCDRSHITAQLAAAKRWIAKQKAAVAARLAAAGRS